MLKTAITLAAFHGKNEVQNAEVLAAARFVLPHRMRRKPFEEMAFDLSQIERSLGEGR